MYEEPPESVVTIEQVGVVEEKDPSEHAQVTEEGCALNSELNIARKIFALADVDASTVSETVYVAEALETALDVV